MPSDEPPELTSAPAPETPEELSSPPPPPPPPPGAGKIQWGVFFRTASPLSALTGFLACLFFPLAIALVLPLSLRRILNRYRPYHLGGLGVWQGARLGAFMALLSFASFLIFALPTLSVKHDAMVEMLRDRASQYPDPQAQQMALWFTTRPGFALIIALMMLFFLIIFLIVGAASGALMASQQKNRGT